MADIVQEQTSAFLSIDLFDKADVLAQPTSASYEIHDEESGSEIRAEAAATFVGGQIEITLNKVDNTLVDQSNQVEYRKVSVHAIYTADDELHDSFVYEVHNLTYQP